MKSELMWSLKSIACSKCEGTSYWCMSCNIEEKINDELNKYEILS